MQYVPVTTIFKRAMAALALTMVIAASPAAAQIEEIDPNDAIGTDFETPAADALPSAAEVATDSVGEQPSLGVEPDATASGEVASDPATDATSAVGQSTTFQKDDLIGAAEGVFGKGAEGLAGMIEKILKKQGEPNAYIVGREGGGALILGVRYGSGTLYHKVEGEQKAYWRGLSAGFDAGANAGSTFVLVYNLYDSEELFRRYPSAEGVAYLIGGFNASYLRRGDVVIIPIRVGAGLRLGANVGYMKFSKKQRWLPF